MDSPLLAFQAVSMISITDAVCYVAHQYTHMQTSCAESYSTWDILKVVHSFNGLSWQTIMISHHEVDKFSTVPTVILWCIDSLYVTADFRILGK